VATVSIGKSGARNAGILAVQILALNDETLQGKLQAFKQDMAAKVVDKAKTLEDSI
jgi:phosphoribosylcarboxyaminoimidazole (NCAIR) mutase